MYVCKFWSSLDNSDYLTALTLFMTSLFELSRASTKFSLVHTQASYDRVASESVIDALMHPVEAMMVAFQLMLHAGTGFHLTQSLERLVRALCRHVSTLLAAASPTATTSAKTTLPVTTGCVWDLVTEAEKLPRTNQIAMKRGLLQCVLMMNDVVEELQELVAQAPEDQEEDEGEENGYNTPALAEIEEEDELASFLCPEELPLSSREHARLETFLSTCLVPLKQLTQQVILWMKQIETKAVDRSAACQWFDDFSNVVERTLQAAVVDIGPSFYSPQNGEELLPQVMALLQTTETLVTLLEALPEGVELVVNGHVAPPVRSVMMPSLKHGHDVLVQSFHP